MYLTYSKFRLLVLMLASVLFLTQEGILVAHLDDEDAETGIETVKITEGTNIAVTVSPDHSKLVMDLQGVLWTLPMTGGTATRITNNFVDPSFPDWSPDKKTIVFQSYIGGNYHIGAMNPNGSNMRQLTFGTYDDREPSYSPDGRRIAFSSDRGGSYDILVLDLQTGDLSQWTDSPKEEYQPTWSPDGKKLAYSSDKAGTEDIYILNLESGVEQRLTSFPGAEVASAWSPDGTQIAYQDENGVTYTVDVDTGKMKQAIERQNLPRPPTWGPNGKTIALAAIKTFSSRFREGTNQILIVNLETGSKNYVDPISFKSLSNRHNSGPVWSPDGKHMTFVIESQLWVMPVDENGNPAGEPRRVTDEIADSPSMCQTGI